MSSAIVSVGLVTALVNIVVERDDDALVVSWEAATATAGVDIGVGPTPDAEAHVHVRSVPVEASSVRLDGLGSARQYVSMRVDGGVVVLAAERRVPFEGIQNFRDLGGYATIDGGTVRWGQLFRADALHKLTAVDLGAFDALGVRTVYDLRGDAERTEFPEPFESIHLPIVGRPEGEAPPAPPAGVSAADGESMLRDMYVGTLIHSAAKFGQLFSGLADAERLPAVFHCHGGKDRTGIVAALLLLALGVDRETVLDDYEATRRYRTIVDQQDSLANLLAAGVSPEAAAGVLGAPRWAMAAAVDAVDEEYGGIETYLTTTVGLPLDTVSRLRDLLVAH
jgi:protein-tyrosine phosphatase